jgi:hypothetical protein
MAKWLSTCILAVVITSASLSVADWAACMFYLIPRGNAADQSLSVCKAPGERAAGTLSALLATLIGIGSNPPKGS